jgi:hypothetical protein
MNLYRSTLRRRQLLKAGSVAAFGALGSALAGRRLFTFGSHSETPIVADNSASPPLLDEPLQAHPAPCPSDDLPLQSESSEGFLELAPAPRPLEHEQEYSDFLASLDLRHISADEVLDPHRNISNGVENILPPESLWEKLAPTLRVADEIRERLNMPLLRFSSAYRSPRYNREIPGAVRNSYHTRNQALDIVYFCPIRDAYNVAVQLRNEGFFRGGIGLYPTFIHIDTRGRTATWRG